MPNGTAPGYRDAYSGALGDVGSNGYSWSSATSGIGGLDLNFHSQHLNTGFSDGRAHGIQLRCLSE
ncbi:hypothetical protein [uncultured Rikenella sp.]|uniref:hypothetical protein n=1 Tax=uncultured Rikenella sp. TaxID=368003 RepID=UPI00261B7456|nr:hypothetical protein [uncultured Rikenella sp.]